MVNMKEDWLSFKEEGNDFFKRNELDQAVEAYTKGLNVCENEADKAVLYKNRSACYLKLEQYNEAVSDADYVLRVTPNDVKAMFRRCQAHETLGNIEPAFKDVKILIQREPKNTAIQDLYRRLNKAVSEMVGKRNSTSAMINEMIEAIQNENEKPERKKQALENLVVYSRQSGGRDVLLKGGYLQKLMSVLDVDAEKCGFFMKICHGFSENNYNHSLTVIAAVTNEKLKQLVMRYADNLEFVKSSLSFILACLQAWSDHFKVVHKLSPQNEGKNKFIREYLQEVKDSLNRIPHYKPLLELLVALLMNKAISADVRDVVIDGYMKATCFHKAICDFVVDNRGIVTLLEMASTSVFAMLEKEMPLAVNKDTYYHISVAIASIYDNTEYDEKMRQKVEDQAEGIIKILLESESANTNLQGLVALSTMIMANREVGAIICKNSKTDTMSKVISIASYGEPIAKKLGGEVLALAATDKEICGTLAGNALPLLKTLYQSKDNEVRVRGLVGICKVCMKGSGDVKDQILADGGNEKLYKSCRKFLLSDKLLGLKKWAAEALAYLTIDADVKEMVVHDSEALDGLLELAKSGDSTVTYSIVGTFVNLTNSYDKPEKNPELEQVAKFAKHPVPELHEKDKKDAIDERLKILVENGLISALVNFGEVKSQNSKEMIARVFNAIVDNVPYRGKIVAEGGVKALLPLCLDATEKGINLASQALAKIAITSDPRLAFSGQRCMEVVRPFVKLLHFTKEPLHRFESLMALTNLASMNDDVRRRIMKEKGFLEIESLMFEEDDEFRKAATECMCNLVQNEEAFKKFKDTESDRLKLVTMYCGEEPMELSRAASGCLAILSADVEICKRVLEFKSTLDILKFLLVSEDLDVRHRGLYIVANLIACEKTVAETIINDQVFDVLMAYNISSVGNDNCKVQLNRAINAAREWDLIQENPNL